LQNGYAPAFEKVKNNFHRTLHSIYIYSIAPYKYHYV